MDQECSVAEKLQKSKARLHCFQYLIYRNHFVVTKKIEKELKPRGSCTQRGNGSHMKSFYDISL